MEAAGLLPGTNFNGVVRPVVCIRVADVGSWVVTDVEVVVCVIDGTF